MAASHNENTQHQGNVKDPEHDGRLKENREAGRTKGTTEASAERSHGHAKEGDDGSQSHAPSKGAKSEGGQGDLKSREYTDKEGNVHHHTHAKS